MTKKFVLIIFSVLFLISALCCDAPADTKFNWQQLGRSDDVILYTDNNSVTFKDGTICCFCKEIFRGKSIETAKQLQKSKGSPKVAGRLYVIEFTLNSNKYGYQLHAWLDKDDAVFGEIYADPQKGLLSPGEFSNGTAEAMIYNHCIEILTKRNILK